MSYIVLTKKISGHVAGLFSGENLGVFESTDEAIEALKSHIENENPDVKSGLIMDFEDYDGSSSIHVEVNRKVSVRVEGVNG